MTNFYFLKSDFKDCYFFFQNYLNTLVARIFKSAGRRRQSTDNQWVTFCRRNFIRSGTSESVIIMAELGQTRLQCSTATEDKMSPL